jgi:hypothetical protein
MAVRGHESCVKDGRVWRSLKRRPSAPLMPTLRCCSTHRHGDGDSLDDFIADEDPAIESVVDRNAVRRWLEKLRHGTARLYPLVLRQ